MKPLKPLLALTAAAVLLPAAGAQAAPALDGEFPLTGVPRYAAQGPDGNMWVALDGATNDIAKVNPQTGAVTEYNPADISGPIGITAGPDGNMWVTQSGGVAKFAPADPNGATKFAIADVTDPREIVTGPDGNLWTGSGTKALKISTAGSLLDGYPVLGGARGVAKGSDGNLWFADFGNQAVVKVTPTGTATPTAVGGGPQDVAGGPGSLVAYSNPGANPQTVGRIGPDGKDNPTPAPGTDPFGVTEASDGAFWYAQFVGDKVGRLSATGEYTTPVSLSPGAGARYIAPGPDNTLWVSEETGKKIARIKGVEAPQPPSGGGGATGGGGETTGGGGGGETPLPQGGDVSAPLLSALKAKPRRVAFTVDEASQVTIRIARKAPGRGKGAKCVTPSRKLRGAPKCTRLVPVLTRTVDAQPGANELKLDRRLKIGQRYKVSAAARDMAGNAAQVRSASLKVAKRIKRHKR